LPTDALARWATHRNTVSASSSVRRENAGVVSVPGRGSSFFPLHEILRVIFRKSCICKRQCMSDVASVVAFFRLWFPLGGNANTARPPAPTRMHQHAASYASVSASQHSSASRFTGGNASAMWQDARTSSELFALEDRDATRFQFAAGMKFGLVAATDEVPYAMIAELNCRAQHAACRGSSSTQHLLERPAFIPLHRSVMHEAYRMHNTAVCFRL
jgi:hypothetical protein